MGLISARLRQWLLALCQSRSGQCLAQTPVQRQSKKQPPQDETDA